MYIDTARNARHIGKKFTTTGFENYHIVCSLYEEKWRHSLMLKKDLKALLPGVLEAIIKINWEAWVFVALSNYFFSLACFYELKCFWLTLHSLILKKKSI